MEAKVGDVAATLTANLFIRGLDTPLGATKSETACEFHCYCCGCFVCSSAQAGRLRLNLKRRCSGHYAVIDVMSSLEVSVCRTYWKPKRLTLDQR